MTVVALTFRSRLEATRDQVWNHVATLTGVNEELWPLSMSGPPGARFDARTPTGQRLFRSRVSLFGVLPLDLHDLSFRAIDPGAGFREASTTLLQLTWEHDRTLTEDGAQTLLEDALRFEPRLPAGLMRAIVSRTFERRHAVLTRKFGGARLTTGTRA